MAGWRDGEEVGGVYGRLGSWRSAYENTASWQKYTEVNGALGPYVWFVESRGRRMDGRVGGGWRLETIG